MHDSSARYPPPKCHPQTRTGIIDFFVDWAKTENPVELVYWLHAPFGQGKSAIMPTIIDRLIEEGHQDQVAGTFFFGHGKHGRDKIDYLLPSIAYQMAINLPGMREIINRAMLADPAPPSKSINIQLRFLIIKPLLEWLSGPHFSYAPTIFIDGLDECDSIDGQLAGLDLITKVLLDHRIPLRFLVASRPEPHIYDHFGRTRLARISKRYRVPFNDLEMTAYLGSKFNEIYERRARIMEAAGIQKPWPSKDQIFELVWRASGQYVFLDTILRFTDVHRLNPADRLNAALSRSADSSVFTEMDFIYRLVLEQCPTEYWGSVKAIIESVMFCKNCGYCWPVNIRCTISCIAEITQYPVPQLLLASESVAAVIRLKRQEDGTQPAFHHLSFYEFLKDKHRSGNYFSDPELATKRWKSRVQRAFKRSLAAEIFLVDSYSHNIIYNVLRDVENHYPWTTSDELQELLLRGQSTVSWGTASFAQWYRIVHLLAELFTSLPWMNNQTELIEWLAGHPDTPFTAGLQSQCLQLWKGIADGAFSEMDQRLANSLLDRDPNRRPPSISMLATRAEMDPEECLQVLKEHQSLFLETLNDISDRVELRDKNYVQFDDQGNKTPIRHIRRQFYNPIK
ncbi:hypothetical protein CPB83DRAFT_788289 [Crepidotus variabilis]|uniref:Nephrocystin 3-like N-terminal domain-containing protein n=1 Tax=Crepidotus variabilis TaxID=179855 RepID=A0A9P6EK88_9AGAR|nr:hypothetical protein CPB83DRAFT_788289 [Crepidotus variabilis]